MAAVEDAEGSNNESDEERVARNETKPERLSARR